MKERTLGHADGRESVASGSRPESSPYTHIICDLSEVLIAGMIGVEHAIAPRVGSTPREVSDLLYADWPRDFFSGTVTEDAYLARVLARTGWHLNPEELKLIFRENFHTTIEGSIELLTSLANDYVIAILSDHAREWVEYVEEYHPFLQTFHHRFWSYEIGSTKKDPETFRSVLTSLSIGPGSCVFIDDDESNIERARAEGIDAIHFTDAESLSRELTVRNIRVPA